MLAVLVALGKLLAVVLPELEVLCAVEVAGLSTLALLELPFSVLVGLVSVFAAIGSLFAAVGLLVLVVVGELHWE